jgi:hypothetical protein
LDVLEQAIRETRESWRKNIEDKSKNVDTNTNPKTKKPELTSAESQSGNLTT